MNLQELIQNQCLQKIMYIHKATSIINEDKYLPPQEKTQIQKLFMTELKDTYKLCLPFFANTPSEKLKE